MSITREIIISYSTVPMPYAVCNCALKHKRNIYKDSLARSFPMMAVKHQKDTNERECLVNNYLSTSHKAIIQLQRLLGIYSMSHDYCMGLEYYSVLGEMHRN